MSLTELRCPLEVEVKDKGRGHAFAIIDYGAEADLLFVVILDNGQVWCVPPIGMIVARNWSLGRGRDERADTRG